jgi:4-hydroxybenzoate polyprenyltransferase
MLSSFSHLCRISNLPTAWTNVLAAWLLSGGATWPLSQPLGLALLAASLLYASGMILNDAADARWDAEHKPERPIPRGQVSASKAWALGLGMMLAGAVLFLLAGASWIWVTLLCAAILFYDLWHKPWLGSVMVMGLCRTLLYLTVGTVIHPEAWKSDLLYMPALALGVYVVGVTLTARAESAADSSSVLKKMMIQYLLLVPIIPLLGSFMAYQMGGKGQPPAGAALVLLFMFFVSMVVSSMTQKKGRVATGVGWLLAGIAAVDALAVASVSLYWGLAFMALVPVLKLWQRWVAAT